MIDIYCVRHGQTGGNLAKRHQSEETRLTPEGREQAAKAGAYIVELNPTHVMSSSHVRALQTSNIITTAVDLIPSTSPLFVELKRPAYIYGNRHKSARSIWYLSLWYLGFAGGDGDGKEGESYKAFRDRMTQTQAMLSSLPDGSRIVLVTHSVFISFLVMHLCNKKPVSPFKVARLFRNMLSLKNGSVTHLQYNPHTQGNVCAWTMLAYNQHSHLDT